jgi:RNA polymerase sigma factor (sigma-70 family)
VQIKKIPETVTLRKILRLFVEMMQVEELQIIAEIKRGNSNAYAVLVQKYQNVVFSIALKVLKNREDAEEIAQETFIKAYRSIQSFQAKSKFSTWLFRIAYNTCITAVRKKRFQTTGIEQMGEMEDAEGSYGEFPEEERVKYLEMALTRLSEDDYTLIILYYYQDQNVEEISQVTGLSESNVKVKLFRARNKLYSIMNELMKKEVFS